MLQSRRLGLTELLDVWRFFPRGQSIRKLAYKPDKYKPEKNKPKKNKAQKNKPMLGESPRNIYIQKYQVPRDGVSATQTWLKMLGNTYPIVPRHLFLKDFPAGFLPSDPSPAGARPKRTPEDKKRVECLMKVYVPSLEQYVSPEMIKSIKGAPCYWPDDNEIVLKCQQHLTQVKNGQQCVKNFSLFLRNVANEIVYREKENAADKSADRKGEGEGEGEGKQALLPIIVSEAQTKAMAYNWKKPFTNQLKQCKDKVKRESSNASLSTEKNENKIRRVK